MYTQAFTPIQWAKAQYNLSSVLLKQAQLTKGNIRARYLEQAREGCCKALQVYTHIHVPLRWAETQSTLATILVEQADLADGTSRDVILVEQKKLSDLSFRYGLEIKTRKNGHLP